MKVLWLCNSSALYDHKNNIYNGYGWVESLGSLVVDVEQINLAIAFFHPTDFTKVKKGNIVFYPILKPSKNLSPMSHILNIWSRDTIFEKFLISKTLEFIEDFKPDLIHIFGTEGLFNSIQLFTKIPTVVHLQGLINPLMNSYFPIGFTKGSIKYSRFFIFKNLFGLGKLSDYNRLNKQTIREARNLRVTNFFMGRTDWDRRIVRIFNPNARYFHVDEVLRPSFYYEQQNFTRIDLSKLIIVSTISSTIYKGIDVILKTAKLLVTETNIAFEWKIIGLNGQDKLLKLFISELNITPESVNVEFLGIKTPDQLKLELQNADIFIHPSYQDNSPNSVCEAQIMGLPVIACNVGGVSSIVEHKATGILVPSNGIFELTSWITELWGNEDFRKSISAKAKSIAINRHDKKIIIKDLLNVYDVIISEKL